MQCETFMDRFLALDNGEDIGFFMRRHVRGCERCRREVAAFAAVMGAFIDYPESLPAEEGTDRIMALIGGARYSYSRRVSLSNWIGVGLVLLGSMFLLPFSDSLIWLRGFFGGYIDIPYGIVMGLLLSIYVTVFAAERADSNPRSRKS